MDDGSFLVDLQGVERFLLVAPPVARGAGRQDFDEGEAPSGKGFLDGLGQVARVENGPPGHIGRPRRIGQKRQVERRLGIPQRGGGRFGHARSRCRSLASGHAVVEVVYANHREIHVPPCGMDEMIAADGEQVAVAAEHDHVELRVGQFHARREGNGPAVGGVIGVELDVACRTPRTPDPRYHHRLVEIEAASLHGDQA